MTSVFSLPVILIIIICAISVLLTLEHAKGIKNFFVRHKGVVL
jgi:hypothetical protein